MEYIGEPTKVELQEMLATKDCQDNLQLKSGLSDEEILKKRFKKLNQLMNKQIHPDCIDLIH